MVYCLHNLTVTFERVIDRTNEKAPGFHIYSGELLLGAAWERKTKKGSRYLSVNLEYPTFSSGFYSLYRNDGVEDGYKLVFESVAVMGALSNLNSVYKVEQMIVSEDRSVFDGL